MPPERDIVVIGASAGGIEPLQCVLAALQADFSGTVFVVTHLSPRAKSLLPAILARTSPLPVGHAVDGAAIEQGHVYVAPPDRHLIVERGHMHLTSGPKEQHQRPSINVLFRTTAAAYGERVAGVLLSGELDDGTAGLWEIQRRGGIAIVQNPEEAAFPSMPLSALRELDVNYTVSAMQIGSVLSLLATNGDISGTEDSEEGAKQEMEARLTDLTCPDCRGTIWEIQRGKGKDYRCRVGHTFSAETMLATHFAAQEKALYQAVVALEEGASLAVRLADQFPPDVREQLLVESKQRKGHADKLRELLEERFTFDVE